MNKILQTDRFIRRSEVAALLCTSESVAVSVMSDHGVNPVDLGRGRGRGVRYLESAVYAALRQMHEAANPEPESQVKSPARPRLSGGLLTHSIDEIYQALTPAHPLQ